MIRSETTVVDRSAITTYLRRIDRGAINDQRAACKSKPGLVLVLTMLLSGCDRGGDSPISVPPENSPAPQVETAAIEQQRTDALPVDSAKLQEDAIDALDSGDLDLAFKLVRAARSATPEDPQTIFLTARVLAERNRFAEAIKMLDEMVEANPEARLPVLGQTAEWSVYQGEWREAEDRYRALLEQIPDASMVHRMLARLLIRQGRRLEAAEYLQQLCRVGDIEEFELRSLLTTTHPFADETVTDELEPIGALGRARQEIGLGDWDAALKQVDQASFPRPTAEAALRGRIFAHQKDLESLGRWAADVPDSDIEQGAADYWFAMGVHHAHQGDHRAAVRSFGAAVLLDQTDAEAYLLMSESLRKVGADSPAREASKRAQLIQQTQEIGNQMAGSGDREIEAIAVLSDLLDQLQRPLEALAWRAVGAVYGQSGSAIAGQEAMQALQEINRKRLQLLKSGEPNVTEQFILCGVDLDALHRSDDGDSPAD